MIEFAQPSWLWALLGVLPYWWLRRRNVRRTALPFPPAQLLPGDRSSVFGFREGLEVILLASVILGLAGPGRIDTVETISEDGLDVALVLDISASMQAADFPPNRLEALKEISRDFLRRAGGNRVGIHAFAKNSFTQSPLTTDHTVLLDLLDGLSYESINHVESGGTAIGDALLVATDTLVAAKINGRDQVVLLISDGESHIGIDPLLAARHLKAQGIRLHVIGVGGDEPVEVSVYGEPFINSDNVVLKTSLDDTQLREIAATAGGSFMRALDRDVLAGIFDDLGRLERTPIEVQSIRIESTWTPHVALGVFLLFSAWLAITTFRLQRPLR